MTILLRESGTGLGIRLFVINNREVKRKTRRLVQALLFCMLIPRGIEMNVKSG